MDNMNKLTLTNLEETFSKVINLIGEELQSTSTYLMRAKSVIHAVEEIGITTTQFLDNLDKLDYERLIDYTDPIIWADYFALKY